MFGLKPTDIDIILKTFRQYPEIREAIVYGSRAMGNFKPGSDVDIALKGTINLEIVQNVSAELNERSPLPYKFDVIAYSMIDLKPLIDHIDQFGKTLYKQPSV